MVRLIIKRIALAIALVIVLPLIVLVGVSLLCRFRLCRRLFTGCGELLAICPTLIGTYLRKAFYWSVCTAVSPDAHFLFGSMLAHREVTIRKGAVIGPYTFVGYADIGRNVLLSGRVSVVSGKYQHGRPSDRARGELGGEEHSPNHIGDNSWVGVGAIILANVGTNCTVGAGSVVLNDVPDNTTVLGNPARKVNV